MNEWQKTVKEVVDQHPGKGLRELLPIAKRMYKSRRGGNNNSKRDQRQNNHSRRNRRNQRGGKQCLVNGQMVEVDENQPCPDQPQVQEQPQVAPVNFAEEIKYEQEELRGGRRRKSRKTKRGGSRNSRRRSSNNSRHRRR